MPRGGARNRSGPQPDPGSLKSAKLGDLRSVRMLPSAGYTADPPDFPLPGRSARESEVWAALWRTPQACAWALEPWRWLIVADYVRWRVRMEAADAPASLGAVAVRLADQIGMTPAGLKENGWAVARDEVAEKRDRDAPRRPSSRDRLKVVLDADGA